jgi:hypothetical protein
METEFIFSKRELLPTGPTIAEAVKTGVFNPVQAFVLTTPAISNTPTKNKPGILIKLKFDNVINLFIFFVIKIFYYNISSLVPFIALVLFIGN